MGRSRNNESIQYDVSVDREAYEALEARAAEQNTTVEEIVRADLLSAANKERLVPRARKMVRHAKINVTHTDPDSAGKYTLPSIEPGLDD